MRRTLRRCALLAACPSGADGRIGHAHDAAGPGAALRAGKPAGHDPASCVARFQRDGVTNPTYPEKRIHTRSFRHVETDRLVARLGYLREHGPEIAATTPSLNDLRALAREIINCERELAYRGVRFEPVTAGEHLDDVPLD